MHRDSDVPGLSRRSVVTGAAAVAATAVLAGCEVYGGSSDQDQAAPTTPATPGGTGGAGAALAKTSEVPVGGGRIFADQKVVVTQPTAGAFQGFSAVCTHQRCTVSTVQGGTINCPCHGSKFAIADGSVVTGPAPTPLPAKNIRVDGDSIVLT